MNKQQISQLKALIADFEANAEKLDILQDSDCTVLIENTSGSLSIVEPERTDILTALKTDANLKLADIENDIKGILNESSPYA